MGKETEQKIVRLLKQNPRGMTIVGLSKCANCSAHTAAIVLARLEGAQMLDIRRVGSAKLHYWKG